MQLLRTPEPELMDDAQLALAYDEADFAAPHRRFVELFCETWPQERGPIAGLCLDLGCGPADVSVRLASACPALCIDGVDGAEAMLALGRARVLRAGLQNRVRLYRGRLPDDPLPRTRYDIVTSNSLLHHLHDPQVLWRTVRKASHQGSWLFVMDLMRPASSEDALRLTERYAKDEPELLRRDFHASLHAAFTPTEVEAQLFAAGLPSLRVAPVSDRHLIVTGVLP